MPVSLSLSAWAAFSFPSGKYLQNVTSFLDDVLVSQIWPPLFTSLISCQTVLAPHTDWLVSLPQTQSVSSQTAMFLHKTRGPVFSPNLQLTFFNLMALLPDRSTTSGREFNITSSADQPFLHAINQACLDKEASCVGRSTLVSSLYPWARCPALSSLPTRDEGGHLDAPRASSRTFDLDWLL